MIRADEIQKTHSGSLVDALRFVPGLDITETGGPGGTTAVRIRGTNAGQLLVLVDGVRINDASSANGEADFSGIPGGLVERIEVLRGPQSALYGADAMGGVINIITRRGRGPFKAFGQVEGGSYGTLAGNAGAYGQQGAWSYSFAGSGFRTDGFSRYGHRVARLKARAPYEKDGTETLGGFGRIGFDSREGFRFEAGGMITFHRAEYDAASVAFPDTPSATNRRFFSAFAKAELDTFDNRLTHALTLTASRTDRMFRDTTITVASNPNVATWRHSDFTGDRFAAEYQGTYRLEKYGSVIFGTKAEREIAVTFNQNIIPLGARTKSLGGNQTTLSAFGLWQVPLTERLDVSLGGRVDHVTDVDTFATWRATAAYRITETGSKLRASLGTGGKAPTLYQRFGGYQGSVALRAEHNLGADVGIDQDFLDGRIRISATGFWIRSRDLINFQNSTTCLSGIQASGCYVNVARAESTGFELEGTAQLWTGLLQLRGAYTYLRAKDLTTNRTLARRPESVGKIGLAITPWDKWSFEPSVTLVSKRFSGANETQRLAPYARFDMLASYKPMEQLEIYIRGENLNNARYHEVWNYGTTGRAFYAGMKTTW
ncbi:MAG: TonB-dependent receptor [Beijerinckiaceae bacterium]|nr:TonB-dependent receptor [Beijerinckiaceae bacterium]MCZ8299978.1 TonB-dependent receptor [Beijerinckiaceae bacterium]